MAPKMNTRMEIRGVGIMSAAMVIPYHKVRITRIYLEAISLRIFQASNSSLSIPNKGNGPSGTKNKLFM
jgi:hypothetical protein